MTHEESKKNANTNETGAQRRAKKQRQTKGRDRREAQRDTEREREMQHKRGSESGGRNERQLQSRFPVTKSTPGVDLVARFGNLNLHQ
jgi:hypothetical protein